MLVLGNEWPMIRGAGASTPIRTISVTGMELWKAPVFPLNCICTVARVIFQMALYTLLQYFTYTLLSSPLLHTHRLQQIHCARVIVNFHINWRLPYRKRPYTLPTVAAAHTLCPHTVGRRGVSVFERVSGSIPVWAAVCLFISHTHTQQRHSRT
jgi:hypothetical protein